MLRILERREYTGCTVNFKTYTKSLKFKKRMENPVENQKVFEDTQPAIIEKGQWERVQELRKNKRRPTKTGRMVLCQEKVQIKYAFFRLAYPAKASAFSSNAA